MHEDLRGTAATKEVHDDVENLGVENGWGLEIFSGGGGAGEHEDAGADHGPDTECGQRPRSESFLQTLAGSFGFRDQLVDGLAAEQLVVGSADCGGGFGG